MRGDDPDRLAQFNELAGSEIPPITHRANAPTTFAGEHGTNLQLFHANSLQVRRNLFVDQLVRFYDPLFLVDRIDNRLTADPINNPLAEINNFFVSLVDRAYDNAIDRAAVLRVDDHVLGRINQFAGEITRLSRLQRRVGKAFSSTMG